MCVFGEFGEFGEFFTGMDCSATTMRKVIWRFLQSITGHSASKISVFHSFFFFTLILMINIL